MKTFRQIWRDRSKAIVNGNVWQVVDMSVDGKQAILHRDVRVKAHFRSPSKGGYQASGWRLVEIRRPIDALAVEVTR